MHDNEEEEYENMNECQNKKKLEKMKKMIRKTTK